MNQCGRRPLPRWLMRSSPPHEPRSEVTSSMDNHIPLPDTLQRRTILALNDLGQAVTASLRLDEVFARALNEVMILMPE